MTAQSLSSLTDSTPRGAQMFQCPKPSVGRKADGVDGSRSRHLSAKLVEVFERPRAKGAIRMEITTIGLDLAKSVFQVHAVDGDGNVVVRKALRRAQVLAFFKQTPPCLVGME